MSAEPLLSPDFAPPQGNLLPASANERTTALVHYYRAEMARMSSWRSRIDLTSNWAITVVAGLLSVTLSAPTAHHGVILFGMLLITLLLVVESRRYRFYDVYRTRVRHFEHGYFAEVMAPDGGVSTDWLEMVAEGLRHPVFRIGLVSAMAHRLRRNYVWMYGILLLAWILKVTSSKLQPEGATEDRLQSVQRIIGNAALGPLHGWAVLLLVALFYAGIIYLTLQRRSDGDEALYGDVHV